jgi:prefoldin subunit 5
LRVFGELKAGQDAGQQAVIEVLKQQLDEAREREQFYQQQIRELTSTMKLLEHRPQPQTRRHWWEFWTVGGG